MTLPDTIVKYPSIPHLDEIPEILDGPVQVFEKLDGGNCQIGATNGRLRLATRSGDYSMRAHEHIWFGEFQKWANRFYAALQRDLAAPLEELLPANLVLFGEWLSPHTIEYRPEATSKFHLIDVYDLRTKRFLPYDEGTAKATIEGLLPLRALTTLYAGRITMRELEDLLPGSGYRDGDKEGVVVKDYQNQRFAKLVNQEFSDKQKSTIEGGRSLDQYLTPQRLRKCALTLKNTNANRQLDQKVLYATFYRDVVKESPFFADPERLRAWFDQHIVEVLSDPQFRRPR